MSIAKKVKENPAAWFPKSVCILGTTYEVVLKTEEEDKDLANRDGYIWYVRRLIVIRDHYREWLKDPIDTIHEVVKGSLRHEIMHAFLQESGLSVNSVRCSEGWAKNEEMVDWFAIQAPKIFEVYKKAGCL